jgi:hypothetical protein
MRTMKIQCDVCQGDVVDGGAVSVSIALKDVGLLRKDFCSIACLHVTLTGIVLDLEKEYPEEVARSRAQTLYGPGQPWKAGVESGRTSSAAPNEVSPPRTEGFAGAMPMPGPSSFPMPVPSEEHALFTSLHANGYRVGEAEFAGWTRLQRGVAQAWVAEGAKPEERPVFFDNPPGSGGCSACDAGVLFDEANGYKHTGEGSECNFPEMNFLKGRAPEPPEVTAARLATFSPECIAASTCICGTTANWTVEGNEAACAACFNAEKKTGYWLIPEPAPVEEKRGRGRPKGSKNKKAATPT